MVYRGMSIKKIKILNIYQLAITNRFETYLKSRDDDKTLPVDYNL